MLFNRTYRLLSVKRHATRIKAAPRPFIVASARGPEFVIDRPQASWVT